MKDSLRAGTQDMSGKSDQYVTNTNESLSDFLKLLSGFLMFILTCMPGKAAASVSHLMKHYMYFPVFFCSR